MAERCAHGDCNFESRAEYCVEEAADSDGVMGLVLSKLDELIYQPGVVTSDEYRSRFANEEQNVTRSFSYLHMDLKSWIWPVTESKVVIDHTIDKVLRRERYAIALSWLIKRADITGQAFTTTYALDVYPQGPVQAYVEELGVHNGQLEGRRVTSYDLGNLYTELDRVSDLHTTELTDNARVQKL